MTTIEVITITGACCVTLLCAVWLCTRSNEQASEVHESHDEPPVTDSLPGGPY